MNTTTNRDWIHEGAKVALYKAGWSTPTVRFATVEKLTATQVVLSNGDRYRRDTLRKVGGGSSYHTPDLMAADDPRVLEAVADVRRSNAVYEVKAAADKLRRGDDPAALLAALDEIATAVEAARAAIGGAE